MNSCQLNRTDLAAVYFFIAALAFHTGAIWLGFFAGLYGGFLSLMALFEWLVERYE